MPGSITARFTPLTPLLLLVLAALAAGALCIYLRGPNKRLDWFLMAVLLALPCHALALAGARSAGTLRPFKLDLYIYQLDGLLGGQLSFAVGNFVLAHVWLAALVGLAYELLPFAIAAVFTGYLWRRSIPEAHATLAVFILNLALSVPFYLICPVSGPAYAFPGFPALPNGPVMPHPIPLEAPPNGVPSIHFSTALLILWYARILPWGRWIAGAYLALMALATLGFGEHYLFDLVIAVPYAALVYKLGNHPAVMRLVTARQRRRLAQAAR